MLVPTKPTIALCMITKDEEHVIAQAIDSVRSIVDEIIVVDTGSLDQTPCIARSLGATVLEYTWHSDFAAARNHGLEAVKSSWVLVLDADEAIAPSQLQELVALTADPSKCYELVQRHYTNDHRLSDFQAVRGEYPEWERNYRGYFESKLVRLFPMGRGLHYVGRIHELIEPSVSHATGVSVATSTIRLHHYGHTPEILERKNKNSLYRSLGEAKTSETPLDWKAFFELGVECNRPGQREESVEAFRQSLTLNPSYLPTYVNLGFVLCELGRATEAVETLTAALKIDSRSAETHCNLGVALMRLNNHTGAEAHFREALRLNPKYINAYFNLSRALANQSRFPEAILIAERISELSPNNPSVLCELGALYLLGGAAGVAVSLLQSALQLDPSMEQARTLLLSTQSAGSSRI